MSVCHSRLETCTRARTNGPNNMLFEPHCRGDLYKDDSFISLLCCMISCYIYISIENKSSLRRQFHLFTSRWSPRSNHGTLFRCHWLFCPVNTRELDVLEYINVLLESIKTPCLPKLQSSTYSKLTTQLSKARILALFLELDYTTDIVLASPSRKYQEPKPSCLSAAIIIGALLVCIWVVRHRHISKQSRKHGRGKSTAL